MGSTRRRFCRRREVHMWRMIETDAPAGSIIEHQGAEWLVHGPSDWPGEAECERVEDEDRRPVCRNCGVEPALRGQTCCGDCTPEELHPGQVHADFAESDPMLLNAMVELEAEGLWEIVGMTDLDRMRARARAANAELLELARH